MILSDSDGYISFTGTHSGGNGAVGDEVSELYPEFKEFNKMHLCDAITGTPMHAFANAWYHFEDCKVDAAKHSLNVTDELFDRWVAIRKEVKAQMENGVASAIAVAEIAEDKIRMEIKAHWKSERNKMYAIAATLPLSTLKDPDEEYDEDEYDDKVLALAAFLDIHPEEVSGNRYDDNVFDACGEGYLVVDDGERDDLWEASIQGYLDELVLPEFPETMRRYFDEEAWKSDARDDGAGISLAPYDHVESLSDDGLYYIYRTN